MHLTDEDYEDAAEILDCEVAAIKAVAEVEVRGDGFLPDGRPKILFEAHVFSRLTHGRYDESHSNISCPHWDKTLYGGAGAHQWDRLNLARSLDKDAANKSCSWGMFQIMGENYAACGLPSINMFVESMMSGGELGHLMMFCQFIKSNHKLQDALQERRWEDFARIYNGPRYAENNYHTKLAVAYAEHSHE